MELGTEGWILLKKSIERYEEKKVLYKADNWFLLFRCWEIPLITK